MSSISSVITINQTLTEDLGVFGQQRLFITSGFGWRGKGKVPSSICLLKLDEERLSPFTSQQVLDRAEKLVRADLQQHFSNQLFSVAVFHLYQLPVDIYKSYDIFVSAKGYTNTDELRYSEFYTTVAGLSWDENFTRIMDDVDLTIKTNLESSADTMEGFGIDYYTFTANVSV